MLARQPRAARDWFDDAIYDDAIYGEGPKRDHRGRGEQGQARFGVPRGHRLRDPRRASARAVDLVKRVFGPGTIEVNRLWCGDISFIRTWERWLYLATVIDVSSRRVVGWAMADHMRTELVTDAL